MESRKPLQLLALNHVSRVCADLAASFRFYTEVLGFSHVKRPSSFEFEGAWLHNYGVGLHLIKGCPPPRPKTINPKSCHISFQATSLAEVEDSLVRHDISYVKNLFVEDGVKVGQLFFHDPDDNMIEICNCDVLPVVPVEEVGSRSGGQPLDAAWPASSEGPAEPATFSSAPSSEAGSEDSLQGAYEASSLLEDADATARTARLEGLSEAKGGTADRHEYGSFSSDMSGVMMADPRTMSITAPQFRDWARMETTGASSSASSTSSSSGAPASFLLELEQQPLPPRT